MLVRSLEKHKAKGNELPMEGSWHPNAFSQWREGDFRQLGTVEARRDCRAYLQVLVIFSGWGGEEDFSMGYGKDPEAMLGCLVNGDTVF
jgi:hypothetical protein